MRSETVLQQKPAWAWDRDHLLILAGYIYGTVQTAYPIVAAVIAHGTPSVASLFGLATLAIFAVWGFLKNPPSSVESAIDAGKIAVAQAPGILARRASLRPEAVRELQELPKDEKTLTGVDDK